VTIAASFKKMALIQRKLPTGIGSRINLMKILVLNAGSSSQKSRLYEIDGSLPEEPPAPLWKADADWTGYQETADVEISTARGQTRHESLPTGAREGIIKHMLETIWSGPTKVIDQPEEIAVVGHRVVQGGPEYRQTTLVTPEVKAAIEQYAAFAPSHNPANLEGIRVVEQLLPSVPQVAVFDTAFHRHLSLAAAVYPGPYEWFEQGIRRYGFHGISHHYCAQRAAQLLGRDLEGLRLITCHLGNGCSLAAIYHGQSIDTTMGFTPLEGLMMGSRSGSVDPGILIHLLQHKGYSVEQLDKELNKASGLQGVSGVSSDMRQILQAISEGNPRAKLALDIYVHRLRGAIGAMLATLGGVDAVVFTAGVGEHAAGVRAAACETFGFLNLVLDPQKNAQSPADQDISTADSAVRVLVIQTQEDWMIAQECWRLKKNGAS
jgi:acetate kinase